jgi:hypothetical protein
LPRRWRKNETLKQQDRDQHLFHARKAVTNTDARANSKWRVGVRRDSADSFWRESIETLCRANLIKSLKFEMVHKTTHFRNVPLVSKTRAFDGTFLAF